MRPATPADLPRLVEMGRRFHEASGLPMQYDETAITGFLAGLVASESIIMHDHGCIGGIICPAYCDPSWLMAVELFWWAERDGMPLLRAFEEWAADRGAREIRMTSLASLPRADAVLRRKGYTATEISYSRVIPWQ
jgi:GNAT superfamily N-acetyltransferase